MPLVDFGVYLITDRRSCRERGLTETVREVLEGGVRCVQLREKDLSSADLFRQAVELRSLTRLYGARLIINDRLDVALACGADGIQLGVNGLPIREARRVAGPSLLIGYSAHQVEEAAAAQNEGADFVSFGPVYHTPSKAPFGIPCGVKKLAEAVDAINIPVFALGGISSDRIDDVMETGVRGVAALSALLTADDPRLTATNLLRKIESHVRHD